MPTSSRVVLMLDLMIWVLSVYFVLMALSVDERAEARAHYYAMLFWRESAVWCGRRALAAELRYRSVVQ